MFPVTYGFSADFTAEFWCEQIRYKNALLQLAIIAVDESFAELGWTHLSSVEQRIVCGEAEPIKESKIGRFFRIKVNPVLFPSGLSTMRILQDVIQWQFAETGSKVTAEIHFYIRKTTFLNKPEQERLSSIIQRLFEQVSAHSQKYSLGFSVARSN